MFQSERNRELRKIEEQSKLNGRLSANVIVKTHKGERIIKPIQKDLASIEVEELPKVEIVSTTSTVNIAR